MSKILLNILILLSFLLAGCGKSTIDRIQPETKILAFGDSLTYGVGAGKEGSYPHVLAQKTGCTVINAGVSGEDSTEGLKRLRGKLQNSRPDLVILCFGGNDFLRRQPRDLTESNLREMIRVVKNDQIDIVLIGVPQPSLTLSVPKFYKELAKEFDIPYDGKVLKEVLSKSHLKSDHIHPNKEGYKLIAERIYALINNSESQ